MTRLVGADAEGQTNHVRGLLFLQQVDHDGTVHVHERRAGSLKPRREKAAVLGEGIVDGNVVDLRELFHQTSEDGAGRAGHASVLAVRQEVRHSLGEGAAAERAEEQQSHREATHDLGYQKSRAAPDQLVGGALGRRAKSCSGAHAHV